MEQAQRGRSKLNIALWILQVLLALLYLNAGFLKTFRPIQEIAPQIFWVTRLPEPLVRFIGICEILGAVGLILPAALKIRPQLATIAAAGLALIMLLANIHHIYYGDFFVLPMTVTLLSLAAFIAYGRWKLSPFTIEHHAA
ncbi:MAG TPA: DoxX family protein [Candidatus Hodarchaeales archaeon]|nr:DoxX family protein [Candidatus Hodarchaeales archaeon]